MDPIIRMCIRLVIEQSCVYARHIRQKVQTYAGL